MADEFRIAGAYVEVNLRDNTQADEAKIRARIEGEKPIDWDTALKSPDNAQEIRRMMGAEPPIDLGTRLKAAGNEREIAAEAKAAIGTIEPEVKPKVDDTAAVEAGAKAAEETDAAYRAKSSEKGQSSGRALAAAIAAGVVLGAPLVSAAMVGAATVGFVALGAIAAAGTDEVKQSLQSLQVDTKQTFDAIGQTMGPEFAASIDSMRHELDTLAPDITSTLSNAQPQIRLLTEGIDNLAGNSIPGMLAAVRQSGPVFVGLDNVLSETGTAAGEMFRSFGENATNEGLALTSFGSVVHSVLGTATSLINGLTNIVGQNGTAISSFFHTAETAVSGFIGGAVGPLSSGLGMWLGGFNSILGVLSPMSGGLGQVASAALQVYSTTKLGSAFGSMIQSGAGSVTNLGAKMAATGEVSGSFLIKAGNLASTISGPLGLALGAAIPLIGLFTKGSQEAAQHTAEFQQGVKNLASTLDQSNGAITTQTTQMNAQTLASEKAATAGKTYADVGKSMGLSMTELTDAATGGSSSLHDLDTQLRGNIDSYLKSHSSAEEYSQVLSDLNINQGQLNTLMMGGRVNGQDLDDVMNKLTATGDATVAGTDVLLGQWKRGTADARELWGEISNLNAETVAAQQDLNTVNSAFVGLGGAMALTAGQTIQLGDDLTALSDSTKSAADQAKALGDALDMLSGRGMTLTDAESKLNKAIDQSQQSFTKGVDKAKGWGAALMDADGRVNTLTANGQKLNDDLDGLRTAMEGNVTAVQQYDAAHGKAGQTMQDVAGVVQKSRDAFVKEAQQLGLTAEQANKMADAAGLIPAQVAIQFVAHGNAQLEQSLTDIQTKVEGMPKGAKLVIDAPTQQVEDSLKQIGDMVVHLPGGKVVVGASTDPLMQALHNGLATIDASSGLVSINANAAGAYNAHHDLLAYVDTSVGTANIHADTNPAYSATGEYLGYVNRSVATAHGHGDFSEAYNATGQFVGWVANQHPTVEVWVNTSKAGAALQTWISSVSGQRIQERVDLVRTSTSTAAGLAHGAIVPNATGNMWSTWPSDTASLFQPGQLNLIGDARVPESFIPWDSSPRSTRLLAATNAGMGDPLGVQRPTEQTVTHNYYITVKDNATAYEVAAMVSAEQDYALRAMA